MGRRGHHTHQQLHEMIVAAAFEIMQSEGHNSISTRKIVNKIGYTVGTLYIIFRNLEELFLYINAKTIEMLCESLIKNLPSQPQSISEKKELLLILAKNYHNFARSNFHLWTMLFEYRFNTEVEMPLWYINKIKEIDNTIFNTLSKVFQNESTEEVKIKMALYWSNIHGIVVLDIRDKLYRAGQISAEQLIDKAANTLLNI